MQERGGSYTTSHNGKDDKVVCMIDEIDKFDLEIALDMRNDPGTKYTKSIESQSNLQFKVDIMNPILSESNVTADSRDTGSIKSKAHQSMHPT